MQCRAATYRINSMFRVLYRAGAFLTAQEASFISTQGLEFLKVYALMADRMYRKNKQFLFLLYPKLHMLHHVLLQVRSKGLSCETCLSPMLFATQMDEDAIGRAARLSRRVSIRKVGQRTLERVLTSAFAAYSKAGLLG